MLFVQSVLAVLAIGLLLGFAVLARLVLARFAAQERALAELRSEMARHLGEAEDGELLRTLRHLEEALTRVDEERAQRCRADARYAELSREASRDRDWQRLFE